jgi:putative restriction endonuclease
VEGIAEARVREGKADQPTKRELLRVGATGALVPEAYELLRSDPRILHDVTHELLVARFPDTMHPDVLAAVGPTTICSTGVRSPSIPTARSWSPAS